MRNIFLLPIFFCATALAAQTTLLKQDFNTCAFPVGWQAKITGGNTSPAWYVGLPQNPKVQGQSIDGSCLLFIDDEANGSGSAAYTLDFISPAFDVTPYTTVNCRMNVHFRFGENDFLQILATDGTIETVLARFDNFTTNGLSITDDFYSLKHDLALVSQSATTRLIFRYTSPAGSLGHYAAIDNIEVTGSGSGTNLLREGFNFCQKPAGWQTQVFSGTGDWKFGRVPLGSSAFYNGNSMDGSCFVFFDDNAEGQQAIASAIRLTSPWFAGKTFFEYELNCDAMMRFSGTEAFSISLENNQGKIIPLYKSAGQVAGPFFPQYAHFTYDLSPYRADQLRLIFEYSDGGIWGYWTGIDNVKVTARAPAIDFCDAALPLFTGAPCTTVNNKTALFDGPPVTCTGRAVGSLWYQWQADFSGTAKLSTGAKFNDVAGIYTGDCNNPQLLQCFNRDEHGFTGETLYFTAQAGTLYHIRLCGQDENFGAPRGDACVSIEQVASVPAPPVNDLCDNAVNLTANGPCTVGTNRNATISTPLPSRNLLARADVWYKFTEAIIPPNQKFELISNADFSDVITVYRGGCANLQEFAGTHNGSSLELPALSAGETYWVQIAGTFATVEGNLCPQLVAKSTGGPANDDCQIATVVVVDGSCVSGNNIGASFSGNQPSCAVSANRDIWFKFTAPSFGSVHINTGANFEHVLAVWEGSCNALTPVFCRENPKRCDGYVTVSNLNAGQTYYVQIASWDGGSGLSSGTVCLEIRNGSEQVNSKPAELSILQPCIGMDSARLVVNITGGLPPFSFSGNQPGEILLSGEQYVVVATDAKGCEIYATGIVEDCASNECTIELAVTEQPISCPGGTDGSLTASVQGGTGPFIFKWSNGKPTSENPNLPAGLYSLTVTDANGCEKIISYLLNQPDSFQVSVLNETKPGPGQSNGALDVDVQGGTMPYATVEWYRQGLLVQSGPEDLTAVPGGDYELRLTDARGCTYVFSYTLNETSATGQAAAAFVAELFPNPAKRNATLTVALPTAQTLNLTLQDALGRPLRHWQFGPLRNGQLPLDLGDLPAGVYRLRVQGDTGGVTRQVAVLK